MKTEGNLTSCPQNRTRRCRIEADIGRELPLRCSSTSQQSRKPPFLGRAGEEDVKRQKVGGHTDELAGAST